MKKETQCVHSGTFVDPATGGVNTPIYTSSAFGYIDEGKQCYPRYFNTPNQEAVVQKLCALEGAEEGVLFSSGMAAISTTFLALLKQGDHVVLQDGLYGGTHDFITQQLNRFGIDYSFAASSVEEIADVVADRTKLIYVESPTNPLINVTDIARVAEVGKANGIVTAIDSTFASPINQNPLALGIDIVLHSGTKYLGGHSDLCCGVALGSRRLMESVQGVAKRMGGSLNASTCALIERSLKTLALRVERQTENGGKLARYLDQNPAITQVFYPGLVSHSGHAIAKDQMQGFGAMVSFEIEGATEFMKRLKLITPALSLGGVESSICSPALTSHASMSSDQRQQVGISDDLLRLSVGIEHIDDLIQDIDQAIE